MPFSNVLTERQRPKSCAIIRENGDLIAINASVEALRQASAVGKFEVVRELCLKSVPITADSSGKTALHYAATTGHLQIVNELIANLGNVNAKDSSGYAPLHLAATEGHIEVVKLLLRTGAHIDAEDEIHGNTAVHEAAWKGYSQTIEVLCKHKANLHVKNKGGFSPLHLVCQQGHNQSCRVLLLNGSSPDLKNNYGDTPLHTAARYGHAGVVRILISAFCNVNDVNKNGDTALHISAAMGRRKLTKILLENACDANIKNKQEETAMDIAIRKSFKEVHEILANPPAVIEKPVSLNHKRTKDGSQGSKESKQLQERHQKKNKSGARNVHFGSPKYPHNSPYGCPLYPDMTDFPKPKLDSLPTEPLQKGEQYYVDLAGNIRKGPVGKVFNCYCVPIFKKVEKKMEKDKEELKEHIHTCHNNLKEKITSLEKKTSNQLITLHQTVTEKFAVERTECMNRNNRRSLRERLEFERRQQEQVEQFKGEMRCWLESKLSSPMSQQRGVQNFKHIRVIHTSSDNHQPPNRCDRPRSCLGITHKNAFVNGQTEVMIPPLVLRSKSEVQLNASDEECDDKNTSTLPEIHSQLNGCNGHQVTDIDQDQNGTEGPHTTVNGGEIMSAIPVNEHVTDLMRSLRCNGPDFVPNGDYRDSPYSDSGYRTKFSPSPKECPVTTQIFHKYAHAQLSPAVTTIQCINSQKLRPSVISNSSVSLAHNKPLESATIMSQNSSLV